jgi:hypothetical protein
VNTVRGSMEFERETLFAATFGFAPAEPFEITTPAEPRTE